MSIVTKWDELREGDHLVSDELYAKIALFILMKTHTEWDTVTELDVAKHEGALNGLRIVAEQMERIPIGADYQANVYSTDATHVVHLWCNGESFDISVPKREFLEPSRSGLTQRALDGLWSCPHCGYALNKDSQSSCSECGIARQ